MPITPAQRVQVAPPVAPTPTKMNNRPMGPINASVAGVNAAVEARTKDVSAVMKKESAADFHKSMVSSMAASHIKASAPKRPDAEMILPVPTKLEEPMACVPEPMPVPPRPATAPVYVAPPARPSHYTDSLEPVEVAAETKVNKSAKAKMLSSMKKVIKAVAKVILFPAKASIMVIKQGINSVKNHNKEKAATEAEFKTL